MGLEIMGDYERVTIDPDQFKVLAQRINAMRAELQIIRERLGPVDKDKSLYQIASDGFAGLITAIGESTEDSGKWQSFIRDEIRAGFALVAEALTKSTLPPPQPKLKGGFTLILKNNQPDFGYDFDVSGITDEEGEAITDPAVLAQVVKEVTSDNSGVIAATPADEGGAGTVHVGTSGSAALSGKAWLSQADKDAGKDPALIAVEPFTITTGDPAAITEGAFKFDIPSGGTPAVEPTA